MTLTDMSFADAERGHEVVVFKAAARAAGQILLTAALKRRREILRIVDWRASECERLGVGFRFNAYAEAADIRAETPDCVVIATGGLPDLGLLSAGQELTTASWDILSGATASRNIHAAILDAYRLMISLRARR